MRKLAASLILLATTSTLAPAAERPMRFWNLTSHIVAEFYLAPGRHDKLGRQPDKNDRDGTVDVDERLRITDTPPAHTTPSWWT